MYLHDVFKNLSNQFKNKKLLRRNCVGKNKKLMVLKVSKLCCYHLKQSLNKIYCIAIKVKASELLKTLTRYPIKIIRHFFASNFCK
jgi:hypothetical protein